MGVGARLQPRRRAVVLLPCSSSPVERFEWGTGHDRLWSAYSGRTFVPSERHSFLSSTCTKPGCFLHPDIRHLSGRAAQQLGVSSKREATLLDLAEPAGVALWVSVRVRVRQGGPVSKMRLTRDFSPFLFSGAVGRRGREGSMHRHSRRGLRQNPTSSQAPSAHGMHQARLAPRWGGRRLQREG